MPHDVHAVLALRAVSYRLSSVPTAQLPRVAAQLSASLWTCRQLLSAPADSLKRTDEGAVVVQRFKTQLSTLLQDRTVEGRWSGVVLCKAAIEAGGLELLSKSGSWVRNLLAILKRSDPPTTRALAVLTLTRIFMLTWPHVSLVREITTPALPTFVSSCLSNASNKQCSSAELLNILDAFAVLLPHHPTIFRTNDSVLKTLIARIVSSTSEVDTTFTSEHVRVAQQLYALLPFVAPKQGGAAQWQDGLQSLLTAAETTCDVLFKPVIESGSPASSSKSQANDLPGWTGFHAGAARLETLLQGIAAHFTTPTGQTAVTVKIGTVFALLTRISNVTPIRPGQSSLVQPNPNVTKEDRDLLFAALPGLHVAVLKVISVVLARFGHASRPLLCTCYDYASAIFAAELFDTDIRRATYTLLSQMLKLDGLSLTKNRINSFTQALQYCCQDLLPEADPGTKSPTDLLETAKRQPNSSQALTDGKNDPLLKQAAADLLTSALSKLDARHVSRSLRAQMDRTAIMTRNKHALLASVMNAAPNLSGSGYQASLLPWLARLFPSDPEVEALIRPRMPVLRSASGDLEEDSVDEEDINDSPIADEDAAMDDSVEQIETAIAHAPVTEADQTSAFDAFVNSIQQKRALESDAPGAVETKRIRTVEVTQINTSSNPIPAPVSQQALHSIASNEDEDDSDIEIPTLTMEQDTDEDEE